MINIPASKLIIFTLPDVTRVRYYQNFGIRCGRLVRNIKFHRAKITVAHISCQIYRENVLFHPYWCTKVHSCCSFQILINFTVPHGKIKSYIIKFSFLFLHFIIDISCSVIGRCTHCILHIVILRFVFIRRER